MDVRVMGVSMAAFTTFIEQFSDVLWNSLLLFLLVGTGVYFTVRLRGVQVRRFGEGFRRVFGGFTLRGKKADAEGMSSFQALTTAIAAQVGTGNITGCATALVSGGPGALFWTWVSAFFGMATIYAEAVLAQHYKTTLNGQVTGGPAYYIRAAFKGKLGKVLAHLVFSRDFADRDGFSRTDHCQRHHCVSFPLLLSVLSWLERTNLLQQG